MAKGLIAVEIPFIPKNELARAEEAARAQGARNRKPSNVQKADSGADEVVISSTSRLMQKLRVEFGKLENEDEQKIASVVKGEDIIHRLEMSPQEIVEGILKGTIYE